MNNSETCLIRLSSYTIKKNIQMVKWKCKSTLMNTGNGLHRCRIRQVSQTHQTKNTNIGVAKKNSRRDGFLSTCCIYFVIFFMLLLTVRRVSGASWPE